jgi:Domain of unknown function (DUF4262)
MLQRRFYTAGFAVYITLYDMNHDPLAKTRADVEKYGWHCLHVAPRVGESGANFTYTIGLFETYGHPEIMIFGLGRESAHGVLRECADMIKAGTRFPVGQPVQDVLSGDFPVIFKAVKLEHYDEYLGTAMRYYGEKPFEAWVLFWPDKDYKFAWESEKLPSQEEALSVV